VVWVYEAEHLREAMPGRETIKLRVRVYEVESAKDAMLADAAQLALRRLLGIDEHACACNKRM
jgi:hypothetical protein